MNQVQAATITKEELIMLVPLFSPNPRLQEMKKTLALTQSVQQCRPFNLIKEPVANLAALQAAVAKHRPQIVHIAAEFMENGRVYFGTVRSRNRSWPMTEVLSSIAEAGANTELIYFNGPLNKDFMLTDDDNINFVIGADKKLCTAAVRQKFTALFYLFVGLGNSVGIAYRQAWQQLPVELQDIRPLAIALRYRLSLNPAEVGIHK
ncbi:hypothetical protein [Sporomusa termitida]|uniref:Uncharacterized protein n=1 Tax=Sporomusa termitida TaxID=2377 RepID=A0A517DVN2_9FIRM|nr:hypothetical protein [Sporomusa termitida]QDR81387.1 hypothetical protein SPTER_27670 [Sporomusa termitida]